MATPVVAKTSTPDPSAGVSISAVSLDQGAGAADQQLVTLADPTTAGNLAQVTAAGELKVNGVGAGMAVETGHLATIDANAGTTADALTLGTGTISAKLRGLTSIFTDVWDNINHWLRVHIENATLAVTQSGAWSVSVSNFPGTQPVSGTVASTVADGADVVEGATADVAVTGDNAGTLSAKLRGLSKILADVWDSANHWLKVSIQNATLAVTQSGAWTVTTTPPANASTNVAQFGGTNVATGTGAGGAGIPRVTVSNDSQVRPIDSAGADLTTTKAIQTSRAVGVQEQKDAGRVIKVFSAFKFTPATTEGMVTLTPITDGTAGSTGTTFGVTSGKRLRLQAISVTIEDSTTTAVGVACYLRMSASGAVTTSSPMICPIAAGLIGTQVARAANSNEVGFPDGIELSGTMQFGISQQGIATADASVSLIGYEY